MFDSLWQTLSLAVSIFNSPSPLDVPNVPGPRMTLLGPERGFVGEREQLHASITGGPFVQERTYHWKLVSGQAELSSTGPAPTIFITGQDPGAVRVSVTCVNPDGKLLGPVEHAMTFHEPMPRSIHFIWAGGTRIMPPDTFKNVVDWARANANFGYKVWLWVDKRTDPDVEDNYKRKYESLYSEPGNNILLKDIEKEGVTSDYSRYEIDKLWPNYGASSDLLRYAILHKFGGAYFDGDVYPTGTALGSIPLFPPLRVSDNSQGQNRVGNDAFICAPQDDVMRGILSQAQNNYSGLDGIGKDVNTAAYLEEYEPKLQATLYRTGPRVVRKELIERGILEDDASHPASNYIIPRFLITTPSGQTNTGNWLKVPIKSVGGPDDVMKAVKLAAAEIVFEVKRMQLFRTWDHVVQVMVATRMADASDPILKRLRGYPEDSNAFTVNLDTFPSLKELSVATLLRQELDKTLSHLSDYDPVRGRFANSEWPNDAIDDAPDNTGGRHYRYAAAFGDIYNYIRGIGT